MKRYESLDGIRGIAALSVLLGHASSQLSSPIMGFSGLAVDLFFMLSGFVIAHSYGARSISFFEFIVKRFIRLYPMFLAGMIIGSPILFIYANIGFASYSKNEILSSILFNVLYLPYLNFGKIADGKVAIVLGAICPVNGPSWSLIFEMLANLFFFYIWQSGKNIWRIVLVALFCILVVGVATGLSTPGSLVVVAGGSNTPSLLTGLPRVFFGFSCGIMLYRLTNTVPYQRLELFMQSRSCVQFVLWVVMLIIFNAPVVKGFGALYYLFGVCVVSPLIVIIGSVCTVESKVTNKLVVFLGWISYPIYCLHSPLIHLVRILQSKGVNFVVWPELVVVVLTLLLAIPLTKFYEEPLRRLLARKLLASSAT